MLNEKELIPNPFKSERVMQSFIIEHLDCLLIEGNDEEISFLDEEFTIKSLSDTDNKRFRSDILIQYGQNTIAIVENKKDVINQATIDQIKRYLNCKQEIFDQLKVKGLVESKESIEIYSFIGIICGNSIEDTILTRIKTGKIDGDFIGAIILNRYFDDKNNSFVLLNSYFPSIAVYNQRDYQKYRFNGRVFGKGRLVLAVIQDYILRYNKTTYADLENVFPQSLQGKETFCEIGVALKKSSKRNFIKADEIVKLSDSEIAVSSQWGIGNIENFITKANELGFTIETI